MKRNLLVLASVLVVALSAASSAHAQEQICPQAYGAGVVCGIKTHEPVETGLGENLALVGALSLGASGILLYFAKRNQTLAPQN